MKCETHRQAEQATNGSVAQKLAFIFPPQKKKDNGAERLKVEGWNQTEGDGEWGRVKEGVATGSGSQWH